MNHLFMAAVVASALFALIGLAHAPRGPLPGMSGSSVAAVFAALGGWQLGHTSIAAFGALPTPATPAQTAAAIQAVNHSALVGGLCALWVVVLHGLAAIRLARHGHRLITPPGLAIAGLAWVGALPTLYFTVVAMGSWWAWSPRAASTFATHTYAAAAAVLIATPVASACALFGALLGALQARRV